MAGDGPYKHTMPSLETLNIQLITHDAPGVRAECSDRQLGTSEGFPSSSQQRRHHRRESDSAVALTWCVLATVAASAIAACAAI
jgi:hypothetical protein